MKILLYNYTQYNEQGTAGGGVTVYLRNLVKSLKALNHEIIFLSSGDRYSILERSPSIRYYEGDVAHAVIYDSPVVAPSQISFYHLQERNESHALDGIPDILARKFGHIDILHFHNIEGLTPSFFKSLRRTFESSKIFYSAHNYNLLCPQVNLWRRNRESCLDFDDGRECLNCLPFPDEIQKRIRLKRLFTPLKDAAQANTPLAKPVEQTARVVYEGIRKLKHVAISNLERIIPVEDYSKSAQYQIYRQLNVELCLNEVDGVLAVSKRTAEILTAAGVPQSKIHVSYIGTRHFERSRTAQRIKNFAPNLHIAYLGYARHDKGFYFFLDCLEAMRDEIAAQLSVTVAAKIADDVSVGRLERLSARFKNLFRHEGFNHENMDRILEGVNLGIVPVLWEDNLPQIAIELVCRGIPILTSDRGGAQEIADNLEFVFKAGAIQSLTDRIEAFVADESAAERFWSREPNIFSMNSHVEDLLSLYNDGAGLSA